MTHDQLQEDLACHLRAGTDRMVWTNTQLGPSGSPRPDVFTVNKSFSRFRTDCYEIKVSVSDLRHDVTSGKWQSYRKFGHAVWFAFPRGMTSLDLVPKECGIILRGDTWRAARKPVPQVMDSLPRDTWLKLLMAPNEFTREPQPRHMDWWRAQDLARKKFGVDLAELYQARHNAQFSYEAATKLLEESAAAINAEVNRTREFELQQARQREERLSEALQDLGVQLGLKAEDVSASTLADALRALRRKLHGYGLQQAIDTLTAIHGAMEVRP